MKEFKTQKAYLVGSWATEIVKGIAFNININDWGIQEYSMFSPDNGESFKRYNRMEVYYDELKANIALKIETESYANYHRKQLKESQDKLKSMGLS